MPRHGLSASLVESVFELLLQEITSFHCYRAVCMAVDIDADNLTGCICTCRSSGVLRIRCNASLAVPRLLFLPPLKMLVVRRVEQVILLERLVGCIYAAVVYVVRRARGRSFQRRNAEMYVTGFSFFHCVASPFHSFVTTC